MLFLSFCFCFLTWLSCGHRKCFILFQSFDLYLCSFGKWYTCVFKRLWFAVVRRRVISVPPKFRESLFSDCHSHTDFFSYLLYSAQDRRAKIPTFVHHLFLSVLCSFLLSAFGNHIIRCIHISAIVTPCGLTRVLTTRSSSTLEVSLL